MSRDILAELLKVGFLTGSRAFGTNRRDSDYDIVYSIDDSHIIDGIIEGITRIPSAYFSGYLIGVDNKDINLIPVHPHEYLPWFLATKAMTATLQQSRIVNKIQKYAIFEGMVALFKATCEQRSTLTEYILLKDSLRSQEALK